MRRPTRCSEWFLAGLLAASLGAGCDDPGSPAPLPDPTVPGDDTDTGAEPGDGDDQLPDGCVVPDTHPSVQAAVDDARCTEVVLLPGRYEENVVVPADSAVRGIRGGASTGFVVLDGGGLESVLRIETDEFFLEQLTVQNGTAFRGGGIFAAGALDAADLQIVDNVVVREDGDDASCRGGGIYVEGALTGDRLVVLNNRGDCGGAGGGIYAVNAATLRRSHVTGNAVGRRAGGIRATRLELTNSIVAENEIRGTTGGSYRGGGIEAGELVLAGSSRVSDNVIVVQTDEGNRDDASAFGCGIYAGSAVIGPGAEIFTNLCHIEANGGSILGGGMHVTFALEMRGAAVAFNEIRVFGDSESVRARGAGLFVDTTEPSLIADSDIRTNRIELACSAPDDFVWCKAFGAGVAYGGTRSYRAAIAGSEVSQNTIVVRGSDGVAGGAGVAIENQADEVEVAIRDSTLASNHVTAVSAWGGGLYSELSHDDATDTHVIVENSTVSGNRVAGDRVGGGGIATWNKSQWLLTTSLVSLHSATLANNEVESGTDEADGAALLMVPGLGQTEATAVFENSIIAGNEGAAACHHRVRFGTARFGLLSADHGCELPEDAVGVLLTDDAGLGSLGNNGGPTRTHVPQADSPALDAGDPEGCTDADGALLETDQRGAQRLAGERCDLGATERAAD